MQNPFVWLVMLVPLPLIAAERTFSFAEYPVDKPPPGFRSVVSGKGKPGDWRIIMEEIAPSDTNASSTRLGVVVPSKAVLAQLSQDPTDEHFPLLIFDEDTYGDFTLSTRFKTVRGALEQMAGIAFRIQDENNYYV